jgi:hemolysin activation/secretion protein
MKRLVLVAAAMLPLLQTPVVSAQALPSAASPGAAQQRQIDEERRLREQGRTAPQPGAAPLRVDVPAPAAAASGAQALRFAVREIRFSPSEILSADELEALARKYRGPQVSLADLQKLVAEINQLYRARGFVTALAVIPPQDVSSGVIDIRLVEGKLGKVSVEGNTSTKESFVTDRLGVVPGGLIELSELESAMLRFNRTNDVQMAGELKPGADVGQTDLFVQLLEPPQQQFQLFTDNLGVPSTGTYRVGASYLNRSLLGYRDELSFLATVAEGLDSLAAVYGFPVNTSGGRFSLGYYLANTAIKRGTLAPLDLRGDSVTTVATLRQPTWVGDTGQLDVVLGAGWSNSNTDIAQVPLQQLDTRYQSLGLEGQLFDAVSNTFASYAFTTGSVTSDNPRDFSISRIALRHNRSLVDALALWASAGGQWSNDVLLPSNQQYFIGGEGSVRGYATGLLSGDQGYTLSLELHHPLNLGGWVGGGAALAATGFAFVDYGRVYPYRPPASVLPPWQQLTGVGFGVRASLSRNLFGTLTYAYGLTDVPLQPRPYALTFQLGVVF